MATLRLGARPWDDAEMPDVCMRCGAPAAVRKDKTFSWYPGWVYVLLLVNLIVFAIVAMVLTKKKRVEVPLCEAHRNHWLWRQLIIAGGLVAFLGLGFVTVIVMADSPPGRNSDLGGLLCVGTIVGLVVWLIVAGVLQATSIRPTEITDRGITLVGIAREFVDAYQEKQDVTGRIDELARERWGRGRSGPSRPLEDSDRVRPTDEDEPRRAPPDAFQEE
jgi:hypothetical protein